MDRFAIKPINFDLYDEEYVRTSLSALKLHLERLDLKECGAKEYLDNLQTLLVEHRNEMQKYYYRQLVNDTVNYIASLINSRGKEFQDRVNDLMEGLNEITHLNYEG